MILGRNERPLAELLPWLTLATDSVVLCKDGGLLAVVEMRGVDQDASDDHERASVSERLEEALRGLDCRFTVWSTYTRFSQRDDSPRQFKHPETQGIHDTYYQKLNDKGVYANTHRISVLFSPDASDRLSRSLIRAIRRGDLVSAVRNGWALMSQEAHWHSDLHALSQQLMEFEAALDGFLGAVQLCQPLRLKDSRLVGFLNQQSSFVHAGLARRRLPARVAMDHVLGEASFSVHADHLKVTSVDGDSYVGALGIKAWPTLTFPGVIQTLFTLPCELTLSQVFKLVDREEAKKHIQSIQRFHLNLERSLSGFLRETLTGEATQVNDATRQISAAEAQEALLALAAERQVYGYYNLSLFVTAPSQRVLEQQLRTAASHLRDAGFQVIRESMHLVSAWSGSLPGQWAQLVRWHFIHGGNVADLFPLATPALGSSRNAHLSRQLGVPARALVSFVGRESTVYHFNFYQQDLGHALVVGPSRSGKSTLVNFLLSQCFQYPNARVIIFDKDHSARIPTLVQGGKTIDLRDAGGVFCNPFVRMDSEQDRRWLQSWLRSLMCHYGYVWDVQDETALEDALEQLFELPVSSRRLLGLSVLLPTQLRNALTPWLAPEGGQTLFDGEEDGFTIERLVAIEMSDILKDEGLARLFMRYAFHRLDQFLSQSASHGPTTIYIEEAWFMLANPEFREQIRDWLKTLPKKLANIVMATQSLEDFERSGIFGSIADNIPTRVYLANPNAYAQRALYQGQFGLNDHQLHAISQAVPKRQFLVVTPTESRLIDCQFPRGVVDLLRSDVKAIQTFDRMREAHPEAWLTPYREALQDDA